MKKCIHCSTELKDTAQFCSVCGKAQGSVACPACGASNRAGAKFCTGCGGTLEPVQEIRMYAQTYVEGNVYAAGDFVTGDKIVYQAPPSRSDEREWLALQDLVRKVQHSWIEDVLEGSLHNVLQVELGFEAVRSWDMVLNIPKQEDRAVQPGESIADIFDGAGRSLLILGEPGAGKTTTLLEIARALVERAEADRNAPIPVVLNLSSWQEGTLQEWLVKELVERYQVSEVYANKWVEVWELVVLLDGLDEVRQEHRAACVEAINKFLTTSHPAGIAVCCRTGDYEEIGILLRLSRAISLKPLALQQVDQYLVAAGSKLATLRAALQQDQVLQDLIRTPLMLSVMSLAYQETAPDDLAADTQRLKRPEGRYHHIFRAYVDRMFTRVGPPRREAFDKAKLIHYLSWLARETSSRNWTVFSADSVINARIPYSSAGRVLAVLLYWGFFLGVLVIPSVGASLALPPFWCLTILLVFLAIWCSKYFVLALDAVFDGILCTMAERRVRRRLAAQDVFPMDYEAFFAQAVGRILLQKVGSDYQFIHQMLREYFASLSPAQGEG